MNRSCTPKAWQGALPLDRGLQAESSRLTGTLAVPYWGWRWPRIIGGATQGCSSLSVGRGHGSHSHMWWTPWPLP